MRTKTLIAAAATLAVSLATSMAQVYSQNIVGYVNLTIQPGFNLIANPLVGATNTLNALFVSGNFFDTVYKFNGSTFDSSINYGTPGSPNWSPDMPLVPGEGVFYQNGGASNTVTFVGTVLTGSLTNDFPAGFSIKSSIVPQSDTLENLGLTNLAFFDTVYFYRNGSYESATWYGSSFSPDTQPNVGEAFWISSTSGGTWTRSFNP